MLARCHRLPLVGTTQLLQLIFLIREIHTGIEGEVLCLNDVTTNSQFESHISHGSHISQQFFVGERGDRHRIGIKHIRSLGSVPVEGYIETLLEHREVETGIKCLLYLPLQIRIAVGGNCKSCTCSTIDGSYTIRLHQGERSIRINGILITGYTISCTNLEIIYLLDFLHPRLIADYPCQGSRREPAPLLTITQLRRTIGTNIDGSDVFVSQHIVDTSHIRAQGIFGVVRLQITPAHIGSSLHVIELEVVGIKSMCLL